MGGAMGGARGGMRLVGAMGGAMGGCQWVGGAMGGWVLGVGARCLVGGCFEVRERDEEQVTLHRIGQGRHAHPA